MTCPGGEPLELHVTAIDLFHITVLREHEFTLEDCIELGGW